MNGRSDPTNFACLGGTCATVAALAFSCSSGFAASAAGAFSVASLAAGASTVLLGVSFAAVFAMGILLKNEVFQHFRPIYIEKRSRFVLPIITENMKAGKKKAGPVNDPPFSPEKSLRSP